MSSTYAQNSKISFTIRMFKPILHKKHSKVIYNFVTPEQSVVVRVVFFDGVGWESHVWLLCKDDSPRGKVTHFTVFLRVCESCCWDSLLSSPHSLRKRNAYFLNTFNYFLVIVFIKAFVVFLCYFSLWCDLIL